MISIVANTNWFSY